MSGISRSHIRCRYIFKNMKVCRYHCLKFNRSRTVHPPHDEYRDICDCLPVVPKFPFNSVNVDPILCKIFEYIDSTQTPMSRIPDMLELQIGLMEVAGICSKDKIEQFRRRVGFSDAAIRESYITYSKERLAYDLSVFCNVPSVLVMDAGSVDGKEFFNILVQSAVINAKTVVYRAILGSQARDIKYYRDCVHEAIRDLAKVPTR